MSERSERMHLIQLQNSVVCHDNAQYLPTNVCQNSKYVPLNVKMRTQNANVRVFETQNANVWAISGPLKMQIPHIKCKMQ